MEKFFKDKLCLEPGIFEVFPLENRSSATEIPYLVKVNSMEQKVAVFQNCSKLRGSTITISDDLTPEERNNRIKLMPALKKLKSEGIKVCFRGDVLYANGKPYSD
jgi:hypothetical protein